MRQPRERRGIGRCVQCMRVLCRVKERFYCKQARTPATERVTLYCRWRLSALTTGPHRHGQVNTQYTLSVLSKSSKPFMRYRGNNIWLNKRMNVPMGRLRRHCSTDIKWNVKIMLTGRYTVWRSIADRTRKHRQSYQHADTRRQQQHTAVTARVTSNRATLTIVVTVWPWPFDLWVNACRATTIQNICTKFGVNTSSACRFPFRARTNIQTDK